MGSTIGHDELLMDLFHGRLMSALHDLGHKIYGNSVAVFPFSPAFRLRHEHGKSAEAR